MSKGQRGYLSYLLRLWKADDGDKPTWRASLEGAESGKRIGFADLAALFAYLRRETAPPSRAAVDPQENETPGT